MTDNGDNIIDMRTERAKRMIPLGSYWVRVDLYETGIHGTAEIADMGIEDMRNVSDNLYALARHFRDEAWVRSQDPDDQTLSVARIYASSRVNCWTSADVETAEQLDWLDIRFSEAAKISHPAEENPA